MMPATRSLAEYIRGLEDPGIAPYDDMAAHEDPYDPKVFQLKMKRRRQMEMVKKMLEDSGYGDLAKMTTLNRREIDADGSY